MQTFKQSRFAVVLVFFAALAPPIRGQVRTDGTLGHAARTFAGPNFTIGPNLGKQVGGNLFHSFSSFDLAKGETANFTGPPSVHNVLARVTGGQGSNMDG